MDNMDNKTQEQRGEEVCVRLELVSVCGRGSRVCGWLAGWVCPFTSDAVFLNPSHRLHPRHVGSSLQSGAGAVGSGLVPAEQRPQAGPAPPLDDAGADLAPRRYSSAPPPAPPTPAAVPEGSLWSGVQGLAAGARSLHPDFFMGDSSAWCPRPGSLEVLSFPTVLQLWSGASAV